MCAPLMHIARVPHTLPPHALPAPAFRFRQLALCAGRAPIGGAREVALACFLAARLLADAANGSLELTQAARAARCGGAKAWLGALSLPSTVRISALRCAEVSAEDGRHEMALALRALTKLSAAAIDAPARAELELLISSLAA